MRIQAIPAGIGYMSKAYLPDRRINNNIQFSNTGTSLVALRNKQLREMSDVVVFSGSAKK